MTIGAEGGSRMVEQCDTARTGCCSFVPERSSTEIHEGIDRDRRACCRRSRRRWPGAECFVGGVCVFFPELPANTSVSSGSEAAERHGLVFRDNHFVVYDPLVIHQILADQFAGFPWDTAKGDRWEDLFHDRESGLTGRIMLKLVHFMIAHGR